MRIGGPLGHTPGLPRPPPRGRFSCSFGSTAELLCRRLSRICCAARGLAVLVVVVLRAAGLVADVRQGEHVLVLENDVDVLGWVPDPVDVVGDAALVASR